MKQTDENLISIVMPAKNAEQFIGETIHSIRAQTHRNWELIAVDDHSEDATPSILREISQKDPRIKLYPNEGQGILPALQTAVKHIRGAFITRMDADDIMPEDRLSLQLDLLKKSGRGNVCTGPVKYFTTAKEQGNGFKKYETWLNSLCKNNNHYAHIYKECVIPSPAWLMYTSDFNEVGGFDGLEYPEDYDFVFRLYEAGITTVSTRDVVLHWRDHPARASRNLEQYRDQTFFKLKWKWFKKLDWKPERPLVLYGAGPKGKKLAREIIDTDMPFIWVSGNSKKTGHYIYDTLVQPETTVHELDKPQIIVAISSPASLRTLSKKLREMDSVYYFC